MDRRTQGDVPLDQRERRMIGAGLLVLSLALGSAASAFFLLWQRKTARNREETAQQALAATAARESGTGASGGTTTAATGEAGDDLKVIEGIGLRIESVLKTAGITTYADLAAQRPGRLETVMREAGTRAAKPDTWPEQARLAAAGEWQALRDLQDHLKRGVAPS
jgi:predicted flap endonuclease-1-like 5' DNA nuclease